MHAETLQNIEGFIYLASPYSKYPDGLEAAYRDVALLTARLIQAKVPVFSPIAHSHGVALHGGIDPFSHEIWLPTCRPLIKQAMGMIVATMSGWRDSVGVNWEIDEFSRACKPIWTMNGDLYLAPFNEPAAIFGFADV